MSNHYTRIFAQGLKIAHTGNSDAHTIDTIGFGATEFPGTSAADLLKALHDRTTHVKKLNEWSPLRVISSWCFRYIESAFARLTMAHA